MAVCFAYFDASGNPFEKRRRHLSVAGFVGLESKWNRFDGKWDRVLREYGIDAFHANKMAQWAKPYDTWITPNGKRDEAKRIKYLQALTRVVKLTVMKAFSVTMSLDDYDAVNADYKLDSELTPYGLCASQALKHAHRWMRKAHPEHETLFIFEHGDADQSDLDRMLKRQKVNIGHPPVILPKRWTDNEGIVRYRRPFEACDLWAYEDGLAVSLIGTGKRARGSMIHLSEQIPYDRSGYRREGLLSICRALNVRRRNESTP